MAAQSARDRRLEGDYRDLRTSFDADQHIDVVALGAVPSDRYRIVYKVPSLRLNTAGKPIQVDATVIEIQLPTGYPKLPPVAKTMSFVLPKSPVAKTKFPPFTFAPSP